MWNDATDKSTDLPVSIWRGELKLFGITLHCHVLSDGRRIVDAADVAAMFEVMAGGPDDETDPAEIYRFRDCLKGDR